MGKLFASVGLFVLLVGAAWFSHSMQRRLSPRHRAGETAEFVRLVITMMVTFAAIALGLLITAAKANFDGVNDDVRGYAVQIIELNRLLRAYGPETADARALLREYTAGVIATTWPDETPPPGAIHPARTPSDATEESSALGRILTQIGIDISALHMNDGKHARIAAEARARFESLIQQRWKLIAEAPGRVSTPFYLIMVLWLVVVFASFGLVAPRNALVSVIIVLCAISIASAVFVIVEMNTPFGGLIAVPSTSMHTALAHLS